MSSKFLESDEVDSKIFAGRVLTLLGEIITELQNQRAFLEEKFFFPKSDAAAYATAKYEESDDDSESYDEVEDEL